MSKEKHKRKNLIIMQGIDWNGEQGLLQVGCVVVSLKMYDGIEKSMVGSRRHVRHCHKSVSICFSFIK